MDLAAPAVPPMAPQAPPSGPEAPIRLMPAAAQPGQLLRIKPARISATAGQHPRRRGAARDAATPRRLTPTATAATA